MWTMTDLALRPPRSRQSLFSEVREHLLAALEERRYGPGERLPSEPELAAAFGVSRPTIREVLRSLETEGFVRRVHGVGTFATERRPIVSTQFDIDLGVTETVEAANRVLGVEIVRIAEERASSSVAERLAIPLGAPTLWIERVIRANSAPVAHAVDVIPDVVAALARSRYSGGSVYRFLEIDCGLRLAGGFAEVTAVTADRHLAGLLGIAPRSALLRTDQVERDADDRPVLFSSEHYVPALFTIRVGRTRRGHDHEPIAESRS
jgi:GntR family transcriptional regulator